MEKDSKERIKQLKQEKQYDQIFIEFGQKEYKKNTPYNYRKEDLKKLKQEGRYEDIFNKYGEEEYNKILIKAAYNERKEAQGSLKALLWKIGQKFKIYTATTLLTTSTLAGIGSYTLADTVDNAKKENAIEYASEIEDYNEKITEYAKEVKDMNLDDVQTFMKVMDDMWGSIQGYKTPEKSIMGYQELDLATEEGYGVCRNMASDVAKKLNAINPEYNARTMAVEMGKEGKYKIADIERKVLEDNETVQENEENEENEKEDDELANIATKIFGNHMVTFVDVKEDKLTLVIDPTNPGLGIYKNGEITMLNSDKEGGLEFYAKEYSDAIINKGGLEGFTDNIKEYAKSFAKTNLTEQEIESKYGLEAQNIALNEVRYKNMSQQEKFRLAHKVEEKDLIKNDNKDSNEKTNQIELGKIKKEMER